MSDFNNSMNEFFAIEKSFEVGYKEGYKDAIEEAVEWLENHNDYIDVKDGNVTYFDMGKCVEDFRKAMKGGEE